MSHDEQPPDKLVEHTAIALVSPAPADAAPSAPSPSPSSSGASSDSSDSTNNSSSAASSSSPASSSAYSSSVASSSPASSYQSSLPAASALDEGKAADSAAAAARRGPLALPRTPRSGKTIDSDITTLPITPFRKSCLCRCLAYTFAVLAVLGTIIGVLVQQHVLWFVMPSVSYEKGGSAFQLSAVGPAGEVGGQEYATDFYMTIGVTVDNPNNYPLTFSDVALALTDFRGQYVGTASHEDMVTVAPHKSKSLTLDAEIHTTLPEMILIADDCEAHGMTTNIQAAGSLRAQVVPHVISFPVKMGPYKTAINCAVKGPDGKPIIDQAGHIHLPPTDPAAAAVADTPPAAVEGKEAPVAVGIDGAGHVALQEAAVPAAAAAADPATPVADPAAAVEEPGKDEAAAAPAPAVDAPPVGPVEAAPPAAAQANGGGGGGGGWLWNGLYGWRPGRQ